MGLSPLPYCLIQSGLVARRIIMGNRKTESNPFHWDHIVQNLPFSKNYKSLLPKIKKVQCDGLLGSNIVIYVDNDRINAASDELAWQASSSLAKGLCWLGFQDAARKH